MGGHELRFCFLRQAFFFGHFVFFCFLGEIFGVPGFLIEAVAGDATRVDDDVGLTTMLEIDAGKIGGSGLQAVEHQAAGFGIELAAEDEAHDLHERDLDGVGVFENRKLDGGGDAECSGIVQVEVSGAPAIMEVAESLATQRGRAALGAIGFDVLTAWDIAITGKTHNECSLPLPPDLTESLSWRENCPKSIGIKKLLVKSLQSCSCEDVFVCCTRVLFSWMGE